MMVRHETHNGLKPPETCKKGVFEPFLGNFLSNVMQKNSDPPFKVVKIFPGPPDHRPKKVPAPLMRGQKGALPKSLRSPSDVNYGRSPRQIT